MALDTLTGVDHIWEPLGTMTSPPSEAALMAACVSAALPSLLNVLFPRFWNDITDPAEKMHNEKTMISLLECIRLIDKITGMKSEVKFDKGRFGDLRYYVSDISKAKEHLGWEPSVLPKEGVGKLIDWIKENEGLFVKVDEVKVKEVVGENGLVEKSLVKEE